MKPAIWVALLIVAGAPRLVFGQAESDPPPVAPAADDKGTVRFQFTNHPSLRVGSRLRVDFRVKLQGDFRTFDASVGKENGFELHRRRIGVQGEFLKYFEYEVERELREHNAWRDVFLNVTYFDNFQVRGGKFKMPFGLEELTGATDLDFIHRSNVSENLTPARAVGAAVHGQFNKRMVGYEAGVFSGDGEDEDARFERGGGAGIDRTFAARVTGRPARNAKFAKNAGELSLGFGITSGTVPEGLNSLRLRTAFSDTFVAPVYVQGPRLRLGVDASWEPGPFSAKAEFIRATDERTNEGVRQDDLPPAVAQGWYMSGSWVVTGEAKFGGPAPRRPVGRGGLGAVEIATRYERLTFGSSSSDENDSISPRGANLLENSDYAWTSGVNWYLNRWIKVQVNAIREWITDASRSPVEDRHLFWTRVVRLQFVL